MLQFTEISSSLLRDFNPHLFKRALDISSYSKACLKSPFENT